MSLTESNREYWMRFIVSIASKYDNESFKKSQVCVDKLYRFRHLHADTHLRLVTLYSVMKPLEDSAR